MTDHNDAPAPASAGKTIPFKCAKCDAPLGRPLVCDACHTLNASAMLTDYFTLLGLPRQYELDGQQLHRSFIDLCRHSHPDHAQNDSPKVQELHLRVSATLNEAHRTLKDPVRRAEYLLELLGGQSSAQDKRVPDGFLGTMMMMQEELAEAKAGGDAREAGRIASVMRTQRDGLMKRISNLFEEHRLAVSCEAVRKDLLDEIRRQLNAVAYVRKLLSQVEGVHA
ncbi:MAG: Fe-S protein assembly co-chaperone HscB [Planctomycetes bacterium]|jgi:molecular chaperone HscB|nr:Fe-S protein assembly co-chaperone HscB [Planctomycetota bacterium]